LKNDQELLGLYHGISHKDRGFWYGNVLPDRIIIYRKPLERISANSQDLRENIRQTVVHEVGHYFGFDEEALRRFEEGDF
jgi:predicted Zn-dependent protease with MMP-like domain